jgi:phosphatidylglycerophosphate synthase
MAEFATRDLWRIPGLLSLSRIPLGALFAVVSAKPVPAIAVLFLAAATDVADGWYARRFHEESPTGRVLDPITDKIFVATVVVSLMVSRTLSLGEALLLGMREISEIVLMLLLLSEWRPGRRPVRGANHIGKAATVMQFTAVAAILLESSHRRWWVLSTAGCGLLAGLSYAVREWRDRAPMGAPR